MKKFYFLMLSIFLVTGTAFAGGSIFGSKSKASNPNGVFSIGVHICGSLNCPNVILKQGDCGEESHTRMQYGVCVCEEGYQVEDDHCVAKDGKKDTPWEPSPCATDDDCAEDEQCMGEFCLKIQTEEVSCSSDEMLVDINGDGSVMGCIPCLDNEPLPNALVTDCAETCLNREVTEVDGMEACALKECPAGYAMDEINRICHTCDDSEAWWDEDTEMMTIVCNQCSNREMMEDPDGRNVCALKTCSSGYTRDIYGECISCDDPEVWVVENTNDANVCNQCSNREIMEDPDGAYVCALKTCPSGYAKDYWGYCDNDCSDITPWGQDPDEATTMCAQCPNRGMIVTPGTDACVLKTCPDGYAQDEWGSCYDPNQITV